MDKFFLVTALTFKLGVLDSFILYCPNFKYGKVIFWKCAPKLYEILANYLTLNNQ